MQSTAEEMEKALSELCQALYILETMHQPDEAQFVLEQVGSMSVTEALEVIFEDLPELRQEYLNLLGKENWGLQ